MTVLGYLVSWKFLVYLLFSILGLVLLFTKRARPLPRFVSQLLAFILFGGIAGLIVPALAHPLGLHPSPMCSFTKLIAFGYLKGKFAIPLVVSLVVIVLLSIVARKLFCGWICPLGAMQEMLYLIPGVKKVKNFSFRVTNTVRLILFLIFIAGLLLYGIITYDYFNAFEALHWGLEPGMLILLAACILTGIFYYRPYCYMVCPIGLLSWVLEPLAPLGLRLKEDKCTKCGDCLDEAPCPALEYIIEGKRGWIPDCTSCGLCLNSCPTDALIFSLPLKKQLIKSDLSV